MTYLLAFLSSMALEYESLKGLAWYLYYRARYSKLQLKSFLIPWRMTMAMLGFVPVPPPFDRAMPYLKFAVALAGVVLGAVAAFPLSAPLWIPVAIQLVTALGVYLSPNVSPAVTPAGDPDPVTAAGPAPDNAVA